MQPRAPVMTKLFLWPPGHAGGFHSWKLLLRLIVYSVFIAASNSDSRFVPGQSFAHLEVQLQPGRWVTFRLREFASPPIHYGQPPDHTTHRYQRRSLDMSCLIPFHTATGPA